MIITDHSVTLTGWDKQTPFLDCSHDDANGVTTRFQSGICCYDFVYDSYDIGFNPSYHHINCACWI